MARIVLDPGHGGSQTIQGDSTWNNAVGPTGTLEKNLTLDLALRADPLLRAAGHDVRLTRATDVNLRLRDRAAIARQFRAHVFVSIHFNGSAGHNAQGTETLVHLNHSNPSARLSLAVQDALLPVTGLADRNRAFSPTRIKPQSLGVLRPDSHDPATAACLVEVSFLDRADEERRLQSPQYLKDVASALARGIDAFAGPAAGSLGESETDAGDAIEIAARETPGQPSVPALLGLDVSDVPPGSAPAPETDDRLESPGIPTSPFPRSFLNNSGPGLAILAGQPAWPDLPDFVQFISALGLRHFAPDEFLVLGAANKSGKCRALNSYPPRQLWNNIANSARMIEAIRHELGAPIRITSCFRSPAYNACIGGAPSSAHLLFNAIDFTCRSGTPEIWRRVAARVRASDPRFSGGIGVYPATGFLHIDTRGSNADW